MKLNDKALKIIRSVIVEVEEVFGDVRKGVPQSFYVGEVTAGDYFDEDTNKWLPIPEVLYGYYRNECEYDFRYNPFNEVMREYDICKVKRVEVITYEYQSIYNKMNNLNTINKTALALLESLNNLNREELDIFRNSPAAINLVNKLSISTVDNTDYETLVKNAFNTRNFNGNDLSLTDVLDKILPGKYETAHPDDDTIVVSYIINNEITSFTLYW